MSDSKVEVKEMADYIPIIIPLEQRLLLAEGLYAHGYRKSPIANNGVSLEDILEIMYEFRSDYGGTHIPYEAFKPCAETILAKLPTTAPRGGDGLHP